MPADRFVRSLPVGRQHLAHERNGDSGVARLLSSLARRTAVVGIAERADKRTESAAQMVSRVQIWNLLVRSVDRDCTPGPTVGVELRGYSISGGDIVPGEWVEIDRKKAKKARRGDGLRTHEVHNLTRGQYIKGRRY